MGKEVANLKNSQLIKIAAEALKTEAIKISKNETGGVLFIGQDSESKKITPLGYSIFGEKITVHGKSVVRRSFDIPSNTKLDKLVIGYSTNGSSSSYGLSFEVKWNVINSVDLEIESGAKYKGKWGGSKFKVKY